MPRLRNTRAPRPYGRQAKGKTIKSLSLDDDVAARIQKEAEKRGMNFSEFVNAVLKGTITLSLAAILAFHAIRSPRRWTPAALGQSAKIAWTNVAKLAR